MQSKSIALTLLFSVFTIGLFGIPNSYGALTYDISDETCGGLINGGFATWDALNLTCILSEELIIGDEDELIISNSTITLLVDPDGILDSFGIVTNHGTITNNGEFYVGDMDNLEGAIINNHSIFELDGGSVENDGEINNTFNADQGMLVNAILSSTGTINNNGLITNFGQVILAEDPIRESTFVNDGTFDTKVVFIVGGTLTNNDNFIGEGSLTLKPDGMIENSNSGTFSVAQFAEFEIAGPLNINSGTLTNEGIINLLSTGSINNSATLDNLDTISNQCALITGTVSGTPPLDVCPPVVTITSPNTGDKVGNVLPTQITGVAFDLNNFGVNNTVTSAIKWTVQNSTTTVSLPDGSPTSHIFTDSSLPVSNSIVATIDDLVNPPVTDIVSVTVSSDNDGDGYLPGPILGVDDCNDNEFTVNPAGDESLVIDGVDTDCDGFLIPDEEDADTDDYILGTYTPADWIPTSTPTDGNDCDDSQSTVNPAGDESLVIDGVDTDCDGFLIPDEEDADTDDYIPGAYDPLVWLATPLPSNGGGNDCYDVETFDPGNPYFGFDPFDVNPGVLEVGGNNIDDNCDGITDFGVDEDMDGFAFGPIIGVDDCYDVPSTDPESPLFGIDPFTVNPAALEIFGDDVDNNCDDEVDEEKIILPVFQADLTDKQIKKFEKLVDRWEHKINKLNEQIIKLNERADEAAAKGQIEKEQRLRAEADSKSEEVEIFEDNIDIVNMSIGETPEDDVPVHFQDKLTEKTVKKIIKQIENYQKKIDRLNHQADKFDEKAQKYADKGKQKQADKFTAKAASLRAEAVIFEDLQEVLICAVDYKAPPPKKITISGTIRDFHASHPNMEQGCSGGKCSGVEPGIVKADLGVDGTPDFNQATLTTSNAADFTQWYHDDPSVNESKSFSLDLKKTSNNPVIYTFDSSKGFFPIDKELFGKEGFKHNYHFTIEFHEQFTYESGQMFKFTGDDDVWVFIDNKLAIDLGGVHPAKSATVDLDSLGLIEGQTYDIDVFFAERQTVQSNFRIDTSIIMN